MKVEVHIERLVLDGVVVQHPRALGRFVEKTLAEHLQKEGISLALGSSRALLNALGGAIRIGREPSDRQLGVQIAGAVYRGIGGTR